jgi:hypothetical protein
MFKVQGNVKSVGQTISVSEKFSKRELTVEIPDDKYPQIVQFEATQDKCDLLDSIGSGQQVEVTFALRGREWTSPKGETKVFNTLNLVRIEANGAPTSRPVELAATVAADDDNGDLPF